MRRIVIALASTVTGLVLLFSWPTSLNRSVATASEPTTDDQTATTEAAEPSAEDQSTDSQATGDAAPDATTDPATEQPAAEPATTATYTGAAASTRYGDVVVEVTVTGGVLTDVAAVEFPYRDRRDQQINDYAIPILDAAALQAASADIAMVSGATVTSQAYVRSLQDALDQAGL